MVLIPLPRLLMKPNLAYEIFGDKVVVLVEPCGKCVRWLKVADLLEEAVRQRISLDGAALRAARVCPELASSGVVAAEDAQHSFLTTVETALRWVPELNTDQRTRLLGVSTNWLYRGEGKNFCHIQKTQELVNAIDAWIGFSKKTWSKAH